jgi:hypothetical protein
MYVSNTYNFVGQQSHLLTLKVITEDRQTFIVTAENDTVATHIFIKRNGQRCLRNYKTMESHVRQIPRSHNCVWFTARYELRSCLTVSPANSQIHTDVLYVHNTSHIPNHTASHPRTVQPCTQYLWWWQPKITYNSSRFFTTEWTVWGWKTFSTTV